MRTRMLFASGMFALTAFVSATRGDDWPQFRGPGGSATATDRSLPTEWSTEKNVAWKVKVPGYGWSCPVVVGDKVFVTTAVSDKQPRPTGNAFGGGGKGGFGKGGFGPGGGLMGKAPDVVYKWEVHCLSAVDGKTIWKETLAEKKPLVASNPTNGYATETPVCDGERVYAYIGGLGTVVCYDLAGKKQWQAELGAHNVMFGHGPASSPALAAGRLFIQCDNEEKSFLVALDAKTGKELWKTPRTERTAWSSPIVWKNKKRTEVVCVGSPKVRAYDPETGKQLWEIGGMSGQIKASPVAGADLLFVGCGGGFGGFGRPGGGGGDAVGRPLFAVRPDASGELMPKSAGKPESGLAWHLPNAGPSTSSPLFYDGHLYVLEDRGGVLSCLDAATGKPVYKERIPSARSFTSSPWAAGGKVYCLDDAGTTHVIKAGAEFEVLAANKLGEMTWSSPAAAGGAIFLRTVDHLYCIRGK